jgi:hypothetical protein
VLLFLDTETSGLIKRNFPLESPEQPWIVSIACQLCSSDGTELAALRTTIRAHGRAIGEAAKAVHGISSRDAGKGGIAEKSALRLLCGHESLASQSRYVIGHGLDFDRDVISGSLLRNGWDPAVWLRPGLTFIDTMISVAPFCKLPSDHDSGSYKWPSLDQACEFLLGEPPREGRHDAWDDLNRCKRLYFWLRERGAFEVAA